MSVQTITTRSSNKRHTKIEIQWMAIVFCICAPSTSSGGASYKSWRLPFTSIYCFTNHLNTVAINSATASKMNTKIRRVSEQRRVDVVACRVHRLAYMSSALPMSICATDIEMKLKFKERVQRDATRHQSYRNANNSNQFKCAIFNRDYLPIYMSHARESCWLILPYSKFRIDAYFTIDIVTGVDVNDGGTKNLRKFNMLHMLLFHPSANA